MSEELDSKNDGELSENAEQNAAHGAVEDPKLRVNGADVQDMRRAEMNAEAAAQKDKKLSVKIFSIVCTVLTALIVALTCYVVISMIVARAQNKPISLFGTSFAIVQTDSMEPEIMTGDMIFFHECDIGDIKAGDNIVFIAGQGFDEQIRGQNVVHKVVEVTADGLITQGVNKVTNPGPDKDLVTADNFVGICTAHSTFWGKVFSFLSKYGIFILLAIFVVPFIISQIVKIFKLSKQSEGGEESATIGNGEIGQADMIDQTQPITERKPEDNDGDGQDKEE